MTRKALSQHFTITLLAMTGTGLSWACSESTEEDPAGLSACEAMCQKAGGVMTFAGSMRTDRLLSDGL